MSEKIYRPAFTMAPPEADVSRALVICHSRWFAPSVVQNMVGGAYDPLTYLLRFKDLHLKRSKNLLRGVMDIMTLAFKIHMPSEIVLITDDEDPPEMLSAIERMAKRLVVVASLDYVPEVVHVRLDSDGRGVYKGVEVMFSRRKTRKVICGCIDPRLARVRSEIEGRCSSSWFTVPGCVYQLGKRDRAWKYLRLWIRENLRYAKLHLGMVKLKVCPHEDCKAHGAPRGIDERADEGSLARVLKWRVRETENAVRRLLSDRVFKGLSFEIVAVTFNGRPLAIRVSDKRSKRGGGFISLVPTTS